MEIRKAPNDTAALSFVANSEAARYVFVVVAAADVMDRRPSLWHFCAGVSLKARGQVGWSKTVLPPQVGFCSSLRGPSTGTLLPGG